MRVSSAGGAASALGLHVGASLPGLSSGPSGQEESAPLALCAVRGERPRGTLGDHERPHGFLWGRLDEALLPVLCT